MAEELEKVRTLVKVYEQAQRLSVEVGSFRSRAAAALTRAAMAEAEAHLLDAQMILLRFEISAPSGLFPRRREAKASVLREKLAEAEEEA